MLTCQKDKFSLPDDIHFINCAYMAPLMKSVEETGIVGLQAKRNPVNVAPSDFFMQSEDLRNVYSRLINNPQPNRIAIIPSVSYGMANVAKNVKFTKDDHILVVGYQVPSNYYPWRQLADELGVQLLTVFPADGLENRGQLWNERVLEKINRNTRLVAMPNVHWADGTKFDLRAIRKKLDEHEGLLAIDGTQSVGALSFDVQEVRPDALVCAGYKWLMGPYALGVAYYGEYFDNGSPIEHNWINRKNSEDFTNLINYQSDYQPGALRYEVGERSNFILVPMLLEAMKQIEEWGIENIQEYCANLTRESIFKLRDAGYYIEGENWRSNHLFGVYLPEGMQTSLVKEALEKNKVYVSIRGASVRVSPNVYNTPDDIKALTDILLGLI